jgi:HD-GYP domain-containing protein (c-di-GMP phosphodiesterase class II)
MCDMTLKAEDFAELKAWRTSGGALSSRLKNHPADIANRLKKEKLLIPIETITIIEQHHEFPDGSGFPYGISVNRFNQLSAIFIVCQQFTERLHDAKYDFDKRAEILKAIRERYSSKVFDKAVDGLALVLA